MFRGNESEAFGRPPAPENIVMGSQPVVLDFVCSCGASRFKWVATNGRVRVGGFQPEDYVYECLGCTKQHTDTDVKAFFARQR